MAELMPALGYPRFAVQGGDWGAFIAARMGCVHAEKLLGIHVNLLAVRRERDAPQASAEEEVYFAQLAQWLREGTGYQAIQGTRPQTLAYALTDSPAGLAAWIVDKFRAWSDCGGDVESVFSKDQLLANISLYWFTGAIGSSFWPYYARQHRPWPLPGPVAVPTGYAEFPAEILRPPRSLAERAYADIRRWNSPTRWRARFGNSSARSAAPFEMNTIYAVDGICLGHHIIGGCGSSSWHLNSSPSFWRSPPR